MSKWIEWTRTRISDFKFPALIIHYTPAQHLVFLWSTIYEVLKTLKEWGISKYLCFYRRTVSSIQKWNKTIKGCITKDLRYVVVVPLNVLEIENYVKRFHESLLTATRRIHGDIYEWCVKDMAEKHIKNKRHEKLKEKKHSIYFLQKTEETWYNC